MTLRVPSMTLRPAVVHGAAQHSVDSVVCDDSNGHELDHWIIVDVEP